MRFGDLGSTKQILILHMRKMVQLIRSLCCLVVVTVIAVNVHADTPAGSDYKKDVTRTFVSERSGQALESVNSILCMVAQTKYDEAAILNAGSYRALVDESLCGGRDSADKSGDSASGGTGAAGAKNYINWTVNSSRASADAPQVVTAFVHVKGPENQPMTIQAKMNITEGASEFNPTGSFRLNFLGKRDSDGMQVMKGTLISSRDPNRRVLIRFAEQEGLAGEGRQTRAALRRNTMEGAGSVSSQDNISEPPVNETFNFAYNQSYFSRVGSDDSDTQCLLRSEFETSAWRYGLYNSSTGARLSVNGGFPINTASDGSGNYGFIGYYGLFLPPDTEALSDGATVYRLDYDGGSSPQATPYTLVVKDGKLKKHTRAMLTLGDIKNVPLEGVVPQVGDSNAFFSIKRLTWDGATLAVRASASQDMSGPPSWSEVTPPQSITSDTSLLFGELGLFSQALGGQLRIILTNCQPIDPETPSAGVRCDTPTASTQVVFYKESTINPDSDSVPATLTCYDYCPKATSASGMDPSSPDYEGVFDPHHYSFESGILMDGENPATLSEASEGQSWGFNSGPLFDLSAAGTSLACPWDEAQICPWRAWSELSEFYTWETGPNSWNKFTALKDQSNAIISFDPPKQVQFVYPTGGTHGANPEEVDQKYAGNTFFLQYQGFGDLQGIPGKCFNPADPSDTDPDCSGRGKRWVPEFTIPAGSTVTDSDGITTYLVKPLEVEQRMAKAPQNACSGINVPNLQSLWPDLNQDWTDPDLGVEPEITAPPRVVAGVLQ